MARKITTFYLCTNPLIKYQQGFGEFIYHAVRPRFLAEVYKIDAENLIDVSMDGLNCGFSYFRGDDRHEMFIISIKDLLDRALHDKLLQLLRQAAEWYVNCLNQEDAKKFGPSSFSFLTEYGPLKKEIFVVETKSGGSFILLYPGGVRTFKTIYELDNHLEQVLNYTFEDQEKMAINFF